MKRSLFLPVLLMMGLSFAFLISAVDLGNPRLYINSPVKKTDHIQITYEVSLPGFVELHLFDPEGEKIWIKGKVTDRIGIDFIRVPLKPLEAGKRYTFILKYKGKDHNGTFWTD